MLNVTLTRDFAEDPERLVVEDVTDANGDPVPLDCITFMSQSIINDGSHWLDKGVFELGSVPALKRRRAAILSLSILSHQAAMTTQERIDIINEGLAWLKANKPDACRALPLPHARRATARLRRHLSALDENPAIGAFGEEPGQAKRATLTNTLLNRRDKPFLIHSSDHPEGVDFVNLINPIGDKRETTGVVTRMTSFVNHPERYNYDYPVIVKLLNLGQLATILSSGYYANIRDFKNYTDAELCAIAQDLRERYGSRPELSEPPMIRRRHPRHQELPRHLSLEHGASHA